MSKSTLKKFRKNDYSDRDEYHDDPREREFKRNSKRVERALRTKDVSTLVEEEDIDADFVLDCSGAPKTLEKFNIPYDEIYFGKPYAHVYIDDLAVNCYDDLEKELGFYTDNISPRDFNEIKSSNKFSISHFELTKIPFFPLNFFIHS